MKEYQIIKKKVDKTGVDEMGRHHLSLQKSTEYQIVIKIYRSDGPIATGWLYGKVQQALKSNPGCSCIFTADAGKKITPEGMCETLIVVTDQYQLNFICMLICRF